MKRLKELFNEDLKKRFKERLKKYIDWVMYTLGMGVLPTIIKALIQLFAQNNFFFEKYRVELFFLTIIFLVDALKSDMSKSKSSFTTFILIISSVIYTLVLAGDLNILNVTLSSVVVTWAIGAFLAVSFFIDITCI